MLVVLALAMRRLDSKVVLIASVCACVIGGCGTGKVPDVPSGVRSVEVVSAVPGARPTVAITVAKSSTTRQIVAWLDRLHPLPHWAHTCPLLDAVEPTVTLTFRADANGSVLAKATETDYGFGSTDCNPLTITAPGRKSLSLVGGQFLERLQHLLRVNFGFGIGTLKGEIYMAGGPAPSKRPIPGQVKTYLARKLPHHGRGPLSVEIIPRSGQHFDFALGPGVYYLRSTSLNGKPSGCSRITVTVRVDEITNTAVPWGCTIKRWLSDHPIAVVKAIQAPPAWKRIALR